jgi:hypothetical protein
MSAGAAKSAGQAGDVMAAKLDISGQMIDRLRWHALSEREKARRWKTRPRDTGGDRRINLGLIRRGLLNDVGGITERGRAILKACRTKGPPVKKRPAPEWHP